MKITETATYNCFTRAMFRIDFLQENSMIIGLRKWVINNVSIE
tara:strand:+ start:193 stop:321 length:129 start_codon:yes stop_codon:yes gene_type:complete